MSEPSDKKKPVRLAGHFIKVDAEILRLRLLLKQNPNDESLHKQLNAAMKGREKLLLEFDATTRRANREGREGARGNP